MRIHLIAPPQVQTTKAYALDGFCSMTIRFARLLKELGHTVILYASEENEAPCDELVKVLSKEEQKTLLDSCQYQYAGAENRTALWRLANQRTIYLMQKRKQPKDFICLIGGVSQKDISEAHSDLMTVEYSIGYIASFSKYRIFQSDSWRNWTYGRQGIDNGRFFDTTIPGFFDEAEYPFQEKKEPFALYVGRLTPLKGISVACKAARLAGIPLKVIGHGDSGLVTDGAEYLGALPEAEKNEWMARASAVICPTLYLEPFGCMAVEAQLCGTPVICTDFGAFSETVEQGVSGFRCNVLREFSAALKDASGLDPAAIRARAIKKYSFHEVKYAYQRYFERLSLLWEKGWETTD
jgi:glycosyltransferase involved in cell wall biosynthesis